MERKTIFIVDDDMTNLTIGADTLSDSYNIFTFISGKLLLKKLEKYIPDMILLDVDMPDMDGYEVINKIKGDDKTSNVPVIFLTAKSDCESELEGLSLGAIDYIIKPFSPPLLRKRIEVHLLVESQKTKLQDFNMNLMRMVEAKTRTVIELQNAILSTMTKLVDRRDDITGGHIDRTQRYMYILLNKMHDIDQYKDESSTWDMDLVVQSTRLHDIGKIAIRDNILLKPGKLTDEEFEIIKTHASIGEDAITEIENNTSEHKFLEYSKVFVATHHERWDGSGYPRGLKGGETPLLGRAMALVDVYDALVSVRPYKEPFTHEEAVEIISEESGAHFDPDIVDIFLSVSEQFKQVAAR